jgi:hypothetical protein
MQNNPLPWINERNTPTLTRALFFSCLNLMAMGRLLLVLERLEKLIPIELGSMYNIFCWTYLAGSFWASGMDGGFLCSEASQPNMS